VEITVRIPYRRLELRFSVRQFADSPEQADLEKAVNRQLLMAAIEKEKEDLIYRSGFRLFG
jgi:hypothetical protein